MAITLRDNTSNNTGKGAELTYLEMDTNLESFYYSSSIDGTDLSFFTTGSTCHVVDLTSAVGSGAQGTTGAQGTAGTGTQGIQGLSGGASAQGTQGIQGLTGTGAQGTQGPSGAGGGGGISVDNNVDNYVITATGGATVNGEANLTFTPASGFGTQHWLDIDNGGLSFGDGLVSQGVLSDDSLTHSTTTTILDSIPASTYSAIIIEYQIGAYGVTSQRSGTFIAHWNSAGTVSYANYGTVDIGSISETNTKLIAQSDGSTGIDIIWYNPTITTNNHAYIATYRLLKRITATDGAAPSGGGGGGAGA